MVKPGSRICVALMLSCLAVPGHLASMVVANDDPPAKTIVPATRASTRSILAEAQADSRGVTRPSLVADVEVAPKDKDGVKAKVIQRRRAAASVEQGGDEKSGDEQVGDEQAVIDWSLKAVHGDPPKVWLGIGLKEVSGDLAIYLGSSEGVLIESIFPDSPAEAANLREGDLVLAFNGKKLVGPVELVDALRELDESPLRTAAGKAKSESKAEGTAAKEESSESDGDEKAAGKKRRERRADDDKTGEDKAGDDIDSAAGKKAYPNVRLTILRRGHEMEIELKPKPRPELLQTAVNLEVQVGQSGQLPEILKRLPGGARVFRFGTPSTWPGLETDSKRMGSQHMVVVVKDDDGKSTEVRIERQGDMPAKITVTDENGWREIEKSDLERLPMKVQEAVKEAIGRRSTERASGLGGAETRAVAQAEKHAQIQAEVRKDLERVQGQLREGAQARAHEYKALQEAFQKLDELGDIIIVGPEIATNFGKSAEELGQKYQKLAEEVAKRSVKAAEKYAAVPGQLQELQAQVEELKKQIHELQAQLKAEIPLTAEH